MSKYLDKVKCAVGTATRVADSTVPPSNMSTGAPFVTRAFELSNTALNPSGKGVRIASDGVQLIYLKEGSHPGGRLNIEAGGGKFENLYPGSRLTVPFDGFLVKRSTLSAPGGPAKFLVCADYGISFDEPDSGMLFRERFSLVCSSFSSETYGFIAPTAIQNFATATTPLFGVPFIDVSGWKKIQVHLYANQMTSCIVQPWLSTRGVTSDYTTSYLWGEARFSVFDKVPSKNAGAGTGFMTDAFHLDVPGLPSTSLYLEFRDVIPSSIANIGVQAFGVE